MQSPETSLPTPRELNELSPDAFVAAIGPLFEGGERFLQRLAAARPFATDSDLLAAAHEVAATAPEEEQIELLAAHPRIGADPGLVSPMSRAEQGYDDPATADEHAYVSEELADLNELYEARFGFRYVVFVAGRPAEAIVPLLELALRNDREAELRRGVQDAVYIAGDRLARLRGHPLEEEDGSVDEEAGA